MFYLLTGGSANGKSTYAEKILSALPEPRVYVATMQVYDDEGRAKVERHRRLRAGKGFLTVEAQTDVDAAGVPEGASVLLECICNLASNEMFDEQGVMRDVTDKVVGEVLALKERCGNIVVVTNDVGSELGASYGEGTQAYIESIGAINARLAQAADSVCEVVCGIPLPLKGALPVQPDDGLVPAVAAAPAQAEGGEAR